MIILDPLNIAVDAFRQILHDGIPFGVCQAHGPNIPITQFSGATATRRVTDEPAFEAMWDYTGRPGAA